MKKAFWLFDVVLLAVIFVLHEWTKRVMADGNVVANLLSAGEHLPATALIAATSFIVLRLVVAVVLPAVMIGRWGLWLAGRALGLKREEDKDFRRDGPSVKVSQATQPPATSVPWLFK